MSKTCVVAAVLVVATMLSSCAADPYSPTPRQDSGVLTGALAGGALGALLGGRGAGSRVAGAVIGAAAGGLIGGSIGASLDERDRQIAYATEMQALENGQPGTAVGWRGEQSGYYGNIVPGPYYLSSGRRCRQYTHTVYINGRPEVARGTACRNPDGTWTAVA
jgi:surface antigen